MNSEPLLNNSENLSNNNPETSQAQPESFEEHVEKREKEILEQLKQSHPIEVNSDKEQTWINPGVIADTFGIPMDMAERIADKYNEEIHKTFLSSKR